MTRHTLGRYHVAEPISLLLNRHLHDGSELKTVDHEPPLGVLDQEDLLKQGIKTSQLIPGATDVDELGSCVFNATTGHLSQMMPQDAYFKLVGISDYSDTVNAEKFAIQLYHATTDLTGDPTQEWPPTDCGSTGLFVCKRLESTGVIKNHLTAVGADNIVSLLQNGSLILGQPWFEAGFEPNSDGFIDGDGSQNDVLALINSGVAGGHETIITAVEELGYNPDGSVDGSKTVLRCRNSWDSSWGDKGSYRYHLSTLVYFGGYVDMRQVVLA